MKLRGQRIRPGCAWPDLGAPSPKKRLSSTPTGSPTVSSCLLHAPPGNSSYFFLSLAFVTHAALCTVSPREQGAGVGSSLRFPSPKLQLSSPLVSLRASLQLKRPRTRSRSLQLLLLHWRYQGLFLPPKVTCLKVPRVGVLVNLPRARKEVPLPTRN